MTTQLPQIDIHALGRAVQAYRKLSVRHAAEVTEMLRNDGWTETARYCAVRCQQIEQNLSAAELAPCELREDGGITLAEPRPEMVTLLHRLQHNGLSRYEPSPERAYKAAEQRRRESGGGWDNVLKPVVARYQGKVSRIYFRADAALQCPRSTSFWRRSGSNTRFGYRPTRFCRAGSATCSRAQSDDLRTMRVAQVLHFRGSEA